jgi:hypothetical protein
MSSSEKVREMERELARKEQELQMKDREIAELEAKLALYRPPNWPRCRPIAYHNIPGDIPIEHRGKVCRHTRNAL